MKFTATAKPLASKSDNKITVIATAMKIFESKASKISCGCLLQG